MPRGGEECATADRVAATMCGSDGCRRAIVSACRHRNCAVCAAALSSRPGQRRERWATRCEATDSPALTRCALPRARTPYHSASRWRGGGRWRRHLGQFASSRSGAQIAPAPASRRRRVLLRTASRVSPLRRRPPRIRRPTLMAHALYCYKSGRLLIEKCRTHCVNAGGRLGRRCASGARSAKVAVRTRGPAGGEVGARAPHHP